MALKTSQITGDLGIQLFDSLENSSRLGASIAGLGDINGDGIDDLLVSAPSSSAQIGDTYYNGAATSFSAQRPVSRQN